ncbi:similar to Saccharomyces cerevisiae YLR424W SPP382 Essential protein that forms a dimer with Ntr2p [Maudiozyma saulgeensis]|uniref:Similar to Saccharomyces cerevisiae YLR424W SPP382 Essential protein that forms a dimer with Ntr2p n=1 Tax=Maudiozyma saulgeensis TaxID=1789683 RepID=A0A1X7R8J4_9SACH|nr:similar to Saccharomyces cerevisiae YLR424W SPP382 Essential protein that forms a dimer with Ntr2p [Kazachstania saulgeensis]
MEKRKYIHSDEIIPSKKHQSQNNDKDSRLTQRYGIGAQLLSKMGYVSGKGLGVNSSGIVNPIQTESTSSPAYQRAGLGMLSTAQSINDEGITSSSDEDMEYQSQAKVVSFKRSNKLESTDFGKSSRKDITELLNKLDVNSAFDYFNTDGPVLLKLRENVNKFEDNIFMEKKNKLKLNLTEMGDTANRLSQLDNEIPILENDVYGIEEYIKVLEFLKNSDVSDFSDSLHMILKLSDDETVDKLIANQIQRTLKQANWNPLDPEGTILDSLIELLDNLKYRLETNKGFLNRTQTVLYELVFTKMESFWNSIDLTKGRKSYDTVISFLLSYEVILKYIGSYDFILEVYITPQLIKVIKAWSLTESTNDNFPRYLLNEPNILAYESTMTTLRKLLYDKLYEYCTTWNCKTSIAPNSSDLIFIKNFLRSDNKARITCTKYFTYTFLKDYLEKYYDPLIELEEWQDVKGNINNANSLTAVKTFRSYINLFEPNEYNLLLKFIFNELNKVLFQWLLYADDQSKGASISWFNWFINNTFSEPLPSANEIFQINNTLKFLNEWKLTKNINPIHNEDFNIKDSLEGIYSDESTLDDIGQEPVYTIRNIPMRRVISTFREIVEEYCEEHGFLIKKISNKYAHLKYGKDRSSLVPIFNVSNAINNRKINLAMKDDILWVEKQQGKYLPTYLYKIEHLLI